MGNSWKIGRLFGVDLFIHWTFLLIPLLVFLTNRDEGTRTLILAMSVALATFGCVILHELGHALMARVFGIDTRDITLLPIGGIAHLHRIPEKPSEELAIAVAGPAVNFAIVGGLWAGMALAGLHPHALMIPYGTFVQSFLVQVLGINFLLAAFNLLPAFPMDGGRCLRAILQIWIDRLKATEVAAAIGAAMAVLFVAAGLWVGWYTLPILGLFIWFVGQQELAMVRALEYRRQQAAWTGPVIDVPVEVMAATAGSPGGRFSGFVWDHDRQMWVEWQDGSPIGAWYVGGPSKR